MRPDSLLRLWRYINHLLTYLLTYLLPVFIGPMPLGATYRRVDMKALARYHSEHRHILV